ncbi:MAG: hypothetical protein AB1432_05585 [Bacteroidota bacterium]
MPKEFVLDILSVCAKHKYLPDNIVRNFKILSEYKELRLNGMSGKDAREKLSNDYCTSIKNIEFILYGKKNNVG